MADGAGPWDPTRVVRKEEKRDEQEGATNAGVKRWVSTHVNYGKKLAFLLASK